jgi:hypothetical protein
MVVQDDFGALQNLRGLYGKQLRISGASAH